ncbi:hypothetical protein [Mycobacteroides abscessus]|uniref:hypothetical protein n=1 Tax=Mycobacteroides abscessus TaxID=36809 RepID=UPI0009C7D269|nr:hypothetical protein [Mycobacteroides abscessus]SLF39861.1 Uncharacterised protein [Mycobacteroides abscessus subsp. bolletii]
MTAALDITEAPEREVKRCTNGCERKAYVFGVCRPCRESGRFESPLSWSERVAELRALGYPDWEIAKKLGNSPGTFTRQADRHHIGVDELMRELAREEKVARGWSS